MIHDPEVEVTCDGENCSESVFLPMGWNVAGYVLSDIDAARILESDHAWTYKDKKYFCEACSQ